LPRLNKYQHFQIFDRLVSIVMEIPLINSSYEAYKEIVSANNHLDKRWRYSLGHSLEESILNLMESLVMAKHAPKALKPGYLLKAMGFLESSRLKLRLFLEMKIVNETNIFKIQAKLEEVGRMLGGWLRSLDK